MREATASGVEMGVQERVVAFNLKRNGVPFMDGAFSLVAAVFNRLNGSTEESPRSQRQYQDTIGPSLMGSALADGDVISFECHGREVARYVIGRPRGEALQEKQVFERYLVRVAAEMGVEEVAPDGFLMYFRDRLSPSEAVLRDRMKVGVLER